ncbi:MAG: DUF6057 family protein [Phycisphaerales bacterium]
MTSKHEGENREKQAGTRARPSALPAFSPSYLLLFPLCFVYVWLVVEPDLLYYCLGTILPDVPQFVTGWPFLRESLVLPGGLITYVSGFLAQGYYHAWLGAAIIVLMGFGLAELTRRHLAAIGFARASVVSTLPSIALLLVYCRYEEPTPVCLAGLTGLLLSLAFEKLPLRRDTVRVVAGSVLATVGFCVGGGATFLVFAAMTAIHAIAGLFPVRGQSPDPMQNRRQRMFWQLLVLPVAAGIAWALAEYVFLIPASQAFLIHTPFSSPVTIGMKKLPKILTLLMYGLPPGIAMLALAGRILLGGRERKPAAVPRKGRGKDKHAPTQPKRLSLAVLWRPASVILPLVLLGTGLYLDRDHRRKPFVLSNYYSRRGQWDRILELSRHLPKGVNNVYVNHDINRALYHTGRLPYDMFRYPQDPQALLLTHEQRESDLTQLKLCDIFLEFGHVNMAEKLASELLAIKSHCGPALEKLAWISIIKGHPDTARIYLNALKKDLILGGTARSILRGLDAGFSDEQAAYIDRIRSSMRSEASGVTGREPLDETLTVLLERNPRNKAAFEYFMAGWLLTGQVEKIAANAYRLKDLGYEKIPTLYQEALLIYYGSKEMKIDLGASGISAETFQRYQTFVQIHNAMQHQNQQDQQVLFDRLIREFGATYFFYVSFGRVGVS